MASPTALFKYTSAATAQLILSTSSLRWSSPELFNEPWSVKHKPKLDFDHTTINSLMLKTAVSMIFSRDLPAGESDHPLYKAIKRWRSEDRFKDEPEAFDALKELLAPTPETLAEKLKHIVASWSELIEYSRVLCLSETAKDVDSWHQYADAHRGLVLKFATNESSSISYLKQVEYSSVRTQLTSVKEQVEDLVGIRRADVVSTFEQRLRTRPKANAEEKEWRSIMVMSEEELDCGEEPEDWYLDTNFNPQELKAVYFGFQMPRGTQQKFIELLRTSYPNTILYTAVPVEDQFAIDFKKL